MRQFILLLFFAASLCSFKKSFAQEGYRKLFLKEVGWTISLPTDFELIDSADQAARQQRGKDRIEKSNDIEVDVKELRTLVSAKSGFNYFAATIAPFDKNGDGDYVTASREANRVVYITMQENMPDATIDSFSNSQVIDGLRFSKFVMNIKISPTANMTMIIISKYYKGFDFGISYLYLNDKAKKQIEDMIANSTFTKESPKRK
ncbi:MAG: hypothetical protein EOO01_19465 [Chitinophagaceae bacterium]|nr:MAG: hypothetical protein EOO01_19465 [Chitinophagaceae bacterium]